MGRFPSGITAVKGVKNSVHGAFILPSFADEVVDPESGHTVSTGHWQRCTVTLEVEEVGVPCHLAGFGTWKDRPKMRGWVVVGGSID